MNQIPRSALILALAGVLPFAWGLLTLLNDPLAQWTASTIGPRFVGPYVQLSYGSVILAFMSGVLWGFATKAKGAQAATAYGLSVTPALWAFFMVGGGPTSAGVNLITGFLALLVLDYAFWRWNLAPAWWMHLRVLLTGLVVVILTIGVML